jgi:polygalacturonase
MNTHTRRHFVRAFSLAGPGAGLALGATLPGRVLASSSDSAPAGHWFNVRDHGAKGDGTTKDTAAIQAAIDACARGGGGVVLLPAGRFLSGTIVLKDNVTLHLSPSAVLVGSTDRGDYPPKPFPSLDLDLGGYEVWALVYAEGARNIGIEGLGMIDGNGKEFPPKKPNPPEISTGARPRAVFFKNCRRVFLRDFFVLNSACWSVHLTLCENAVLEHLEILSQHYVHQDGIVIDSCRRVRVSGCSLDNTDDCIVLKSGFPTPCEAVTITNCIVTSTSGGIKLGTQSLGGFRDIAISNCVCHHCRNGGLKFQMVDGGILEDVAVSNISMHEVSAPLFFRLGNRGQDFGYKEVERPRPVGKLRNVIVTGVRATLTTRENWPRPDGSPFNPHRGNAMILAGLAGHPVENVTLSDIDVCMAGGGTAAEAARATVPEEEKTYPENTRFGVVPAYGFYLRHVRGVTLRGIRLDLARPDQRPALLADDAEDLEISDFKAAIGAERFARVIRSRGVTIRDSRPLQRVDTFVSVEGEGTTGVALVGNDLRLARTAHRKMNGFAGVVAEVGNLGPA